MSTDVKLAVVSAGIGEPSSTRLLADRLAEATRVALTEQGGGAAGGGEAETGADAGTEAPAPDQAQAQVRVQVLELRELASEIAHTFVTGFPGGKLRAALETVAEADGVIAVTPVFSASYSGLFKSFFDVVGMTDEDALRGKPVLLGATGGSPRHSLVLEHAMRPLFAYLRAVAAPTAVYAATDDWAAPDDGVTPSLPRRIARAGGELAGLVAPRASAGPTRADGPEVVPFEQQLAALRPDD